MYLCKRPISGQYDGESVRQTVITERGHSVKTGHGAGQAYKGLSGAEVECSQEAETAHGQPDQINQTSKSEPANMFKLKDLFKETAGDFHAPAFQVRGHKRPERRRGRKIVSYQQHWLPAKAINGD